MTKNEAACCKKCLGDRTKNGYLIGCDPKCSHDWQIYETADKTGEKDGG